MSISFNTFRNPVQLTTTKTSAAYSAKTSFVEDVWAGGVEYVCKDVCHDLNSWQKKPNKLIKQCSEKDALQVCNNKVKYNSYHDTDWKVCTVKFFRNLGKEKSKKMTCKQFNKQCDFKEDNDDGSPNSIINETACMFFNQEKCKK